MILREKINRHTILEQRVERPKTTESKNLENETKEVPEKPSPPSVCERFQKELKVVKVE